MAAKRDPNEMGTDDETQGFHGENVEIRGNAAKTCGKCWKKMKSILKTWRYAKSVFRLAIFRQKGQSSIIWLEQLH